MAQCSILVMIVSIVVWLMAEYSSRIERRR
jgi:hypothetical protein